MERSLSLHCITWNDSLTGWDQFALKSNVSDSFVIWANCSKKWAISSKNHICHMFLTVFPPFYAKRVSCSRRSEIFFKDWSDQYAIVALYKRATVSESIPSIFKKEPRERLTLFHKQFTLSITKNEQFTWKTDDRIPNPCKSVNAVCINHKL